MCGHIKKTLFKYADGSSVSFLITYLRKLNCVANLKETDDLDNMSVNFGDSIKMNLTEVSSERVFVFYCIKKSKR